MQLTGILGPIYWPKSTWQAQCCLMATNLTFAYMYLSSHVIPFAFISTGFTFGLSLVFLCFNAFTQKTCTWRGFHKSNNVHDGTNSYIISLCMNLYIPTLVENMAKKEPQLFSHCVSFDHPDLQSHNDYKTLFFILRLRN